MAFKVFLDANIILDLTLERREYSDARKIFDLVVKGEIQAFVTTSVIHIAAYWLTKALGFADSKKYLFSILSDIKIIDLPHNTAILALQSNITDVEDALQYFAAVHHRLDYFISNDKKLKKESSHLLPVYTSREFITDIF